MKLPEYIRSHKRSSAIVVTGRLLVIDIPRSRYHSTAGMLADLVGVDYCAGVWAAMSPYIFCEGCKHVHKVDCAIPVTLVKYCSKCNSVANNKVIYDNLAHWFRGLEPEIQQLALQYVYDRQEYYNEITN